MGSRSLPASTHGRVYVNVHNMQPHWTRRFLPDTGLEGIQQRARSRNLAGGLFIRRAPRQGRSTSTHGISSVDVRGVECAASQGTPFSSTLSSSTADLRRLQSLGFPIEERTESCYKFLFQK